MKKFGVSLRVGEIFDLKVALALDNDRGHLGGKIEDRPVATEGPGELTSGCAAKQLDTSPAFITYDARGKGVVSPNENNTRLSIYL